MLHKSGAQKTKLKTKAKKKGDCNSVLWGSWISHASLKRNTNKIENESKNKKGIKFNTTHRKQKLDQYNT
jgi:hypothetical protein